MKSLPSVVRLACLLVASFAPLAVSAVDRPEILLWPDGAPGSEGKTGAEKLRVTDQGEHVVSQVHQPNLTVYLPPSDTATGAAVLVMPGGGHRELWVDHEGHLVAQWLSDHGVAAFVLKYRLAREDGSTYSIEQHSLADAQRGLRLIRHRASEWGVDPARVGVMGFSAGGQLAALSAMRGDPGEGKSADPISRESCVPAFQALIYPGRSAEILPVKDAPPAFLVCGENDRPDISQGLANVYLRFRDAGVSAELHIYSGVGHGFGQRPANTGPVANWLDRFHDWLAVSQMLAPVTSP